MTYWTSSMIPVIVEPFTLIQDISSGFDRV